MSTRRQFLRDAARLAAAASLGAGAPRVFAANPEIRITTVVPGLSVLDGAGCNVVVMKGPDGALLVDGGYAKHSRELLEQAAKAAGSRRVRTLINTHWHPAQTGSNEVVGKAGGEIIAHEVTRLYLGRAVESAEYHGKYGPLAPAGRPTLTTRVTGSLIFAGQPVEYGYLPAAHTSGDLYIHFPAANLLVAGGPVGSDAWPLLDWRNGAWLGGLVKAQEKLAAMVKPDTRVVPAHGRMISGDELKRQHGMFAAFHEKLVVFQNRGMDSGDILAERPLQAHEAQFGDATAFIIGAFRSLNLAYSPD